MLDDIVKYLENANIRHVARYAGLSYPTVLNIKNRKNINPNLRTLNKLKRYIYNAWHYKKDFIVLNCITMKQQTREN